MQQYDDPTAVAALPSPPPAGALGWLTDGQPGVQGATVIRAWIINLIIEEILGPIQAAGLTPSRTNGGQLLQAIQILIGQGSLGFSPVQQGGGPGQGTNKLNLGWDGSEVLLAVDGSAQGALVRKSDLTAAINAIIGGAPGALDTLKELADAINDNASYAATVTNALALKAPIAAPALTTDSSNNFPATPTPPAGDNTTKIANTAWARATLGHKGNASTANGPWWDWDPLTGIVEVWGQYDATITTEGPITVNFPVSIGAFQWADTTAFEASNVGDTTFPVSSWTATSLTVLAQDSQGNNAASASGFFWRARGYSSGQPS